MSQFCESCDRVWLELETVSAHALADKPTSATLFTLAGKPTSATLFTLAGKPTSATLFALAGTLFALVDKQASGTLAQVSRGVTDHMLVATK